LAFAVLTASPPPKIEGLSLYGLRVGVRALPLDGPLTVDTVSVLGATRRMLLKAGAQVTELDLPANFDALVDVQKCVMAYEAARTLAFEYDTYRDQMGPKLVAIIEQGLAVAPEDYRAAIQATAWHRREIAKRFTFDLDVILAPSVNGEAPLGHDATGDPLYCRAWTLLGLPCISLPIGKGVHGMPIGMQFIGAEGADAKLLSIAKAIMLTTHDGSGIESA
jgi:Asp-tRNA(Asn)/Glu-tRNA(Gln) amidotransferase A subunit family amidase